MQMRASAGTVALPYPLPAPWPYLTLCRHHGPTLPSAGTVAPTLPSAGTMALPYPLPAPWPYLTRCDLPCRYAPMWQAYSAHAACIDAGASPCQTIGEAFLDMPSEYSFVLNRLAALFPSRPLVDWQAIATTLGALLAAGQQFSTYDQVLGVVAPFFS